MKLIDKDAVVAEIEKRMNCNETCQKISGGHEFYHGAIDEAKEILSFINSLEVKEVECSTDAFIKKAEKFIYSALNDGIMGTANIEDFMRLFKNYMKGE